MSHIDCLACCMFAQVLITSSWRRQQWMRTICWSCPARMTGQWQLLRPLCRQLDSMCKFLQAWFLLWYFARENYLFHQVNTIGQCVCVSYTIIGGMVRYFLQHCVSIIKRMRLELIGVIYHVHYVTQQQNHQA